MSQSAAYQDYYQEGKALLAAGSSLRLPDFLSWFDKQDRGDEDDWDGADSVHVPLLTKKGVCNLIILSVMLLLLLI